ncbi:hypothetical protein N7539_009242 [Penicillium diatomitis]|uniref:Acyltransferase 3 domain-containing protein n=1 Tax=Penicillium diatomitis TaxID=2819901 RepID=A0A9W9WLB0_9EURO|nr:uncharacterized protein N7539_009242 [Penicillium diatomitis]KAJ5469624.1 hypothetical protein N7539_009242 [Penicillium diatomitis]
MTNKHRANNWIDGLRGVAALVVVTYHLCSCFANWLNSPAMEEHGSVHVFQYPFLRLIVGGRSSVALFFLITGYVNSYGTRERVRDGDAGLALVGLSKTTFTRTAKLVLPTNVALIIGWGVCQLNGYSVAAQVDSSWIRAGAVAPGPTLCSALWALFKNLTVFWHGGVGIYDHTYWTIPFFVKGSMVVYLTLLGTAYTQTRWTKLILAFLYIFAWSGGQSLADINVYAGMLLAELSVDYGPRATSVISRASSISMIIFGLFIASFPDENVDWMPWSRAINNLAVLVVPAGGEVNRYVISVGTTLFSFGVFFSQDARQVLSHSIMNFLGRISFPIYLIHNTLIRTILTWLVYRDSAMREGLHPVNAEGNPKYLKRGGILTFILGLSIFYAALFYTSYLWTIYVDPPCGRLVAWMSEKAFGETEGAGIAVKEEALKGALLT